MRVGVELGILKEVKLRGKSLDWKVEVGRALRAERRDIGTGFGEGKKDFSVGEKRGIGRLRLWGWRCWIFPAVVWINKVPGRGGQRVQDAKLYGGR